MNSIHLFLFSIEINLNTFRNSQSFFFCNDFHKIIPLENDLECILMILPHSFPQTHYIKMSNRWWWWWWWNQLLPHVHVLFTCLFFLICRRWWWVHGVAIFLEAEDTSSSSRLFSPLFEGYLPPSNDHFSFHSIHMIIIKGSSSFSSFFHNFIPSSSSQNHMWTSHSHHISDNYPNSKIKNRKSSFWKWRLF